VSEPKAPFYRRNLLPSWFPGWLAACLLIALGFAVSFGVFLVSENRFLSAMYAGLLGFAFGLAILSIVAVRQRPGQTYRLAPPAAIRNPIVTALVAVYPFIAVTDRSIRWPRRRGHSPELAGGTAAEALGLIGLSIIALFIVVRIWHDRRTMGIIRPSLVLSLLIAVGVLAFALVYVVQRHG